MAVKCFPLILDCRVFDCNFPPDCINHNNSTISTQHFQTGNRGPVGSFLNLVLVLKTWCEA
jgi:hypothetical protein